MIKQVGSGIGGLALGFALLGGALAWTVHLLAVWIITEFGCLSGLGQSRWVGISLVSWMVILVTLLMAAAALAAVLVSRRCKEGWEAAPAPGAEYYAARVGLLSNLLFLLVILFQALPVFFWLAQC